MHAVGLVGLTALAAGWIPQTFQTIKEKSRLKGVIGKIIERNESFKAELLQN